MHYERCGTTISLLFSITTTVCWKKCIYLVGQNDVILPGLALEASFS